MVKVRIDILGHRSSAQTTGINREYIAKYESTGPKYELWPTILVVECDTNVILEDTSASNLSRPPPFHTFRRCSGIQYESLAENPSGSHVPPCKCCRSWRTKHVTEYYHQAPACICNGGSHLPVRSHAGKGSSTVLQENLGLAKNMIGQWERGEITSLKHSQGSGGANRGSQDWRVFQCRQSPLGSCQSASVATAIVPRLYLDIHDSTVIWIRSRSGTCLHHQSERTCLIYTHYSAALLPVYPPSRERRSCFAPAGIFQNYDCLTM